ncbi:MAG: LacI family DNA-binding transcriptional regulator [Paenibacillaceae bacterium]
MKKKEINSTEIAKLAGVSRSTVSRVINDYSNVPEKTKEKVMKLIEQYNYYPNLSAQVLAGKRTRTIGLFLIDSGHVSTDMISNLLIARVIESASLFGYYVLTHIIRNTGDEEAIRSVKESFYQKRIDGGIFIGAANQEPFLEQLIAEGFIVAVVDQDLPGHNESNRLVINFDNEFGSLQAIDYLVSLNHKRIGSINGDLERHSGPAKLEGFKKAMNKHQLQLVDSWMIPGDFNEASGYKAIYDLVRMNGSELPTAIFTANDSVAFGAIRALNELGLHVPEDISIIGFDDHALSSRFKPALTTIHVDFEELMHKLTTALIDRIEKETKVFKKLMIGASLIIRDSCRKI